jgi:hypothetical protein
MAMPRQDQGVAQESYVDVHDASVSQPRLSGIELLLSSQAPELRTLLQSEVAMKAPLCAMALAAFVIAIPAYGQETPIEFRLVPAKANMSGCTGLDAQMSRVHTITPMGDKAVLKSAGGINDTLKQTRPQVFESTVSLGTTTLFVVANASTTPRTLDVTEKSMGCRWNAVAK